jgi:hypothetical protein
MGFQYFLSLDGLPKEQMKLKQKDNRQNQILVRDFEPATFGCFLLFEEQGIEKHNVLRIVHPCFLEHGDGFVKVFNHTY